MWGVRTPEELTDLFRVSGRKVTPQRQCIFRVLQGNVTHPSAEAVYEAVRSEMETISLKTVYQTLHELAELGELLTLDLGTGAVRFDPNVEEEHHHLVCRCCGKVRDLDIEIGGLDLPATAVQGYAVSSTEVVFRGLCEECQEAGAADPTAVGGGAPKAPVTVTQHPTNPNKGERQQWLN